jgi:protein SCO1/2
MKWICNEECTASKNSFKEKGWTLLSILLVLFIPKCAICWAVYMSILSSLGLVIKYHPWFIPVAFMLFLLTLTKLLVQAIRRRNFIGFGLALAAGLLIIYQRSAIGIDWVKILAILLMTIAVMMDNFLSLYKKIFRVNADA